MWARKERDARLCVPMISSLLTSIMLFFLFSSLTDDSKPDRQRSPACYKRESEKTLHELPSKMEVAVAADDVAAKVTSSTITFRLLI